HQRLHRPLDLIGLAHIDDERHGLPTLFADQVSGLVALFLVNVQDADFCPLGGEPDSDTAPDAVTSAGDEGYFVLQAHYVLDLLLASPPAPLHSGGEGR